jgi:hypothetical protein
MYLPSSMLVLHAAVCNRWYKQCDNQGHNVQKKTAMQIIVISALVMFHCNASYFKNSIFHQWVLVPAMKKLLHPHRRHNKLRKQGKTVFLCFSNVAANHGPSVDTHEVSWYRREENLWKCNSFIKWINIWKN